MCETVFQFFGFWPNFTEHCTMNIIRVAVCVQLGLIYLCLCLESYIFANDKSSFYFEVTQYFFFTSPWFKSTNNENKRALPVQKWWERKKIFEQGKYFSVQKNILSWKWMHLLRIIFTFQLWCSPWKLIDIDLIKDLRSIKKHLQTFQSGTCPCGHLSNSWIAYSANFNSNYSPINLHISSPPSPYTNL